MIRKNKRNNERCIFACLLLFLAMLTSIFSFNTSISIAEDINYTSAIEDLQIDSTFKIEDYPLVENDYSVKVIQIAESVNNELFVYTYQPSGDLKFKATTINISTTQDNDLYYINYNLRLIDNSGTLFKYKVEDFKVLDCVTRVYDISSIFRLYVDGIDTATENDNEITEVSYAVSKVWYATTYEGKVLYQTFDTETIEITDKYVGFVRYLRGFKLYKDSCDSHYVAFSTNKPIDKLYEAEVAYVQEVGSGSLATGNFYANKTEDKYIQLYSDDKVSVDVTGLFGHQYTWQRIEKANEFANKESLTEETKENLLGKDWVLRFAETSYTEYNGLYNPHYNATRVNEVTILRLKFETNGQVYNLGVIDNKQTGDFKPDNVQSKWWLKLLLILLAIVLLIAFFPTIVIALVKLILKAIFYVLKGIWWLITTPLSLFGDMEE